MKIKVSGIGREPSGSVESEDKDTGRLAPCSYSPVRLTTFLSSTLSVQPRQAVARATAFCHTVSRGVALSDWFASGDREVSRRQDGEDAAGNVDC